MIEGKEFVELVEKYFLFIKTEFKFHVLEEKIRGNAFYDVQFKNVDRIISVSYENVEDYFLVTIFLLEKNGQLPDYDDKFKTLHLNKLNKWIFSNITDLEILDNDQVFNMFIAHNGIERKLLKSAKELRLFLLYSDRSK